MPCFTSTASQHLFSSPRVIWRQTCTQNSAIEATDNYLTGMLDHFSDQETIVGARGAGADLR